MVLEAEGLIRREQKEARRANRLYVRIPAGQMTVAPVTENPAEVHQQSGLPRSDAWPSPGRNSGHLLAGELGPNKNYINKNNITQNNVKRDIKKSAYGGYENVFLSEEERQEFQQTVPNYTEYIEKISEYQASTGKQYQNHAATIHAWAPEGPH